MTAPSTFRTSMEIASQPAVWKRAAESVVSFSHALPRRGERVAVVGCGTSWFMALACAELRERCGHGETDAFAASEFPFGRAYDRVLGISRSGTTTEVLDLLAGVKGVVPTSAITADPATPIIEAADAAAVLDFADEESVVQTRFATTVLALLRAHLESEGATPDGGLSLARAVRDAEAAVSQPLDADVCRAEQFTFLGTHWTYGLALEAALKMREAAGAWTEAYPAMEYRHGPISITGPGRVVWRAAELREELVPLKAESRRTVTVVSRADGDATVFNQAGPRIETAEWADLTARFSSLVRDARVVVLSGSLPPGMPSDAYARLVRMAAEAGAATILDTSGDALLMGLGGGPSVVKPNLAEIAQITRGAEPADAAAELRALGAESVVLSCGPDGLHGITPRGSWRATPPDRLTGNPTGAGDACVAALAAGLLSGEPWPAVLRDAAALSAASVPCAMAGDFDAALYHQFRTTVSVETTHALDAH
ncbi:PfkB family carbohydrate kinase [Streptomyces niveus]|uniref:PfkB family carbohydrate kinase n=1 Tax=Streptomyces niveus TaxID=193462 RepID=UPI0036C0414B